MGGFGDMQMGGKGGYAPQGGFDKGNMQKGGGFGGGQQMGQGGFGGGDFNKGKGKNQMGGKGDNQSGGFSGGKGGGGGFSSGGKDGGKDHGFSSKGGPSTRDGFSSHQTQHYSRNNPASNFVNMSSMKNIVSGGGGLGGIIAMPDQDGGERRRQAMQNFALTAPRANNRPTDAERNLVLPKGAIPYDPRQERKIKPTNEPCELKIF
jgi:hypothetical protein